MGNRSNSSTSTAFAATGQVIASGGSLVVGIAVLNGTASPNQVNIYDGTSTSGALIASITLAASAGDTVDFTYPRLAATGVYASCTGAVVGAVWVD